MEGSLQQATANIQKLEATSDRKLRDADAVICGLQERLAVAEDKNRRLEAIVLSKGGSNLSSMVAKGCCIDEAVRDNIANLGEKIYNWAQRHSMASLENCWGITPGDKASIFEELRGYTSQDSWESLVGGIRCSYSKVPPLLVQAL